jgi:hypothetical protein
MRTLRASIFTTTQTNQEGMEYPPTDTVLEAAELRPIEENIRRRRDTALLFRFQLILHNNIPAMFVLSFSFFPLWLVPVAAGASLPLQQSILTLVYCLYVAGAKILLSDNIVVYLK